MHKLGEQWIEDGRAKIMWLDTKGLIVKRMKYKTIKNVIDEILVEDSDSGILYVGDVDYKYKSHNVYFADINRMGDLFTGGRWTPSEYYYLFSGALYNVLIIPAEFYKLYPDAYEYLRFRLRGYADKNTIIIEY